VLAAVRRRERIVSSLGELQLFELAALLSAAELYVGPDAGPMHMAAAAGTRVIELGWVPADYPQTSRGARTAGRCWSPWTSHGITLNPPSALFAERVQRREHVQGIAPADIDAALTAMLVPRPDHTGPHRRFGRGRLLPYLARLFNTARHRS
jgi:ADP-heptose:LPS heptosyltransferase